MNLLLAIATTFALVSFVVHTFVGGRFAVAPLLASNLPKATVWLNYLTWHIATLVLLVSASILACTAADFLHRDAAVVIAIIAACISVLSIAVTHRAGIKAHRFPASYLLGGTALFAFWGAFS